MLKLNMKQRLKMTSLHILFSIVLLFIALLFVYGIWYPLPLDVAVGVTSIYLILLAVDLIIGPLLTFVIYKEDKKKLKFDLTVIFILQLGAYIFGLYTLAQGRPVWQVFVVDDIELISPSDVKKTLDYEMKVEFSPSIFKQPQWVAAVYSDNPKKMQQQKEDEMFEGINISARPETYQNLDQKQQAILDKIKPLNELEEFNSDQLVLKDILLAYPQAIGWLPVKAPEQDMVALFDKSGQAIKVVNLRPWD